MLALYLKTQLDRRALYQNGAHRLTRRTLWTKLWSDTILLFSFVLTANAFSADLWNAGSLYDSFELTLAEGHRTEVLGPLFYSEQKETQRTLGVPPFFSYTQDPGTESEEIDFL